MWQEMIVGAIVVVAFAALIRRLWLISKRGSACGGGGCSNCSSTQTPAKTAAKAPGTTDTPSA